jgi:uncharacterized membrane protein (DUF485 family)
MDLIFQIIGYIGLFLLVTASILNNKKQRLAWMISSILLVIYSVFLKDILFIIVNSFVALINLGYLIKWMKK